MHFEFDAITKKLENSRKIYFKSLFLFSAKCLPSRLPSEKHEEEGVNRAVYNGHKVHVHSRCRRNRARGRNSSWVSQAITAKGVSVSIYCCSSENKVRAGRLGAQKTEKTKVECLKTGEKVPTLIFRSHRSKWRLATIPYHRADADSTVSGTRK